MVSAAGSGGGAAILRPRGASGGWRRRAWRSRLGAVVAAVAEARDAAFARFDSRGGHAGVGSEGFGRAVARAAVTDLGEQRRAADDAHGIAKQRQNTSVGCAWTRCANSRVSSLIFVTIGVRGDEREHDRALPFSSASPRVPGERRAVCEQLRGRLASAVAVPGKKRREALFAEPLGVGRAGWRCMNARPIGLSISAKIMSAPGSGARVRCAAGWRARTGLREILAGATELSARSALVSSLSATGTRKRWRSVGASSQSTNASKRSDLPVLARKRGRAAATWLGWIAIPQPGVQQPLDQHPGGTLDRSSATFTRTRVPHSARKPRSSLAKRRGQHPLACIALRRTSRCSPAAAGARPLRSPSGPCE
jgi:hypothetical protein